MTEFSYIGINEDGLVRAVCIDDPRWKRDTAKTIAEWIRMGRTIERLPHEEACERLKRDWYVEPTMKAEDRRMS